MISPDEIHKLFIVKRTQVQMMADRGYSLPEDEINLFINHPDALQPSDELYRAFVVRYTKNGRFSRDAMTESYQDDKDNLIHVAFIPSIIKDKQGIVVVNSFVTTLTELGASIGIIITREGFTPEALRSLEILTKPIIQVFHDDQLYANPTRHLYVPSHVRLSEDERRLFFEKTKIKPGQLPTISIDDPITRYNGWSIGDVIKINRTNLATNKTMVKSSLTYSIVGRVKFDQVKASSQAKVVTTANKDKDD